MNYLPLKINGEKVYAGFWQRLGAAAIDLLVFIPFMGIYHLLDSLSIWISIVTVLLYSLLASAYSIFFHHRFGATIGKMATGIKVTRPNGSRISLKQAVVRSSIDAGFAFSLAVAQAIAISTVDPASYLNADWMQRVSHIEPSLPLWYGPINFVSVLWVYSELTVLLFNKRKRALHDFIAGTVVIHQKHSIQDPQRETIPITHPS